MKLEKHIRRWNIWRKNSANNVWCKIMVLLGIMKSPTLPYILLPEERKEIEDAFKNSMSEGKNLSQDFQKSHKIG